MMDKNTLFVNLLFKMSSFSFDAPCESFAKAENRLADCFIRQIVSDKLHSCFRIPWVLWFWLQLTKTY